MRLTPGLRRISQAWGVPGLTSKRCVMVKNSRRSIRGKLIRGRAAGDNQKLAWAGLFLRLHYRDDQRVGSQILFRGGFDLVERDGLELGVFGVGVSVAQAIELVQRGGHGEAAEVL